MHIVSLVNSNDTHNESNDPEKCTHICDDPIGHCACQEYYFIAKANNFSSVQISLSTILQLNILLVKISMIHFKLHIIAKSTFQLHDKIKYSRNHLLGD